jgi:hypothetical protein
LAATHSVTIKYPNLVAKFFLIMKMKWLLFGSALTLFTLNCTKTAKVGDALEDMPTARKCNSNEVLEQQLASEPGLAAKMQSIEEFTNNFMNNPANAKLLANGDMQIPVVVNVLYNTAAQNVSAAQIQSQIDVLNKDFAATNTDYNNTPAAFTAVRSGDTKIRFVLETVNRKQTTRTSWSTDDRVKKTNQGGLNPTSPTTKLNLWVCNLSGGVLGYAQFPGGNSATDGVVIDDNAFGTTGTASAPFNKGRTATHEVGHWLNLRHIWGDATCGSDQVGDTPTHNTANYGCPTAGHRSTCAGTPLEMTMNYMDYTDDACMYMFSAGQRTRMWAVFAVGGPRASFRP